MSFASPKKKKKSLPFEALEQALWEWHKHQYQEE